jgi:thioredoxin-dependent peroxiredoxin
MNERTNVITFQGQPLTLLGEEIILEQAAPEATVLDNALNPVALSDFRGKVVIVSSVPSLDTPVCDIQTRRFNTEAVSLGQDVVVLTISMDLPFAQARWCGAAGIEAVKTLSDHRDGQFGLTCGLLIKELRLLARSVLVLDRQGTVRHVQIVPELTDEPDYQAVLDVVRTLV